MAECEPRSGGRVTAQDVAVRAGVSRSAVSRFFTPGASVSKKTAAKVKQAAEDLGYRPNVLARSLLTGRSRIVGLVVAYLDNFFYPDVLELLSTRLQERGYHVLVFLGAQDHENIDQIAREILDYQVDGLLLASVATTSDLVQRCDETGVPVVLFNRKQNRDGEVAVVSDNHAGGRMLAEHFVALGKTRIAHIAGVEESSTQIEREAGFRAGLAAAGTAIMARERGDFRAEGAAEAARRMFSVSEPPDAVFVANDSMAFRVMDVLRHELGLNVPEDVAVAGFDDVPIAAWPSYELTTVRQSAGRMVDIAVDLLIDRIEGRAVSPQGTVPVELIVRSSTAGCSGA